MGHAELKVDYIDRRAEELFVLSELLNVYSVSVYKTGIEDNFDYIFYYLLKVCKDLDMLKELFLLWYCLLLY